MAEALVTMGFGLSISLHYYNSAESVDGVSIDLIMFLRRRLKFDPVKGDEDGV